MTVTARFAAMLANTSYESLPEAARVAAKYSILDTIGIMIPPARVDETSRRLGRRVAAEAGGNGPSSLVGLGAKAAPFMAAFVNGCFVQTLDYGDTVDEVGHHPSGQSLPAALALAQARKISGKELITAVTLGQDIGTRLSTARGPSARANRSWFPPTMFGPFAASAAAGKVLGLSEEQFVNALGLALHRVHGQHSPATAIESEVRGIRYGLVAQDGVMCATMAEDDVQMYRDGIKGLFDIYFDGDCNSETLLAGLGETFRGMEASIKPWPCCRASHGQVNAIRTLVERHGITADMIEAITIDADEFSARNLGEPADQKRRPQKSIQSKNSFPFTAAVAVLKVPTIADFLDDALKNPDVLGLADRVSVRVNPECGMILPVSVEIMLKDGSRFSHRSEDMIGTPSQPMSEDQLLAKFKDCASFAPTPMASSQVDRLIDRLLNLETLPDMEELTALLP